MPKPLKWGILGASTIILSKDIDKYAFMCGSNFYESDVICVVNELKWDIYNLHASWIHTVYAKFTSLEISAIS